MKTKQSIAQKIKDLKCIIIVPTYNNEKTLRRVLDSILQITDSLMIVNDGATDSTSEILKGYKKYHQIHFPKNRGKGAAMREAFKAAEKLGFEYGITIDSDGQHFPDDIPVFIAELQKDKNSLLIGSRDMTQEGVPKGNSFGNKFSNFWYKVETGIPLEDTQSGYRLYPLKIINQISFYTTRFEFEIEVIVKAAWKGVHVKNVPIKVLYDESERVTHFRPIKDFARITVLNTYFVIIALFYIKPRAFFRRLKKKGIKRFFFEDVLKSNDPALKKAMSMSLGVFIGISPFWGFQTFLAISLAALFRLNKAISFAFSNISIPPFIPFIIFASLKLGEAVLGSNNKLSLGDIGENFDFTSRLAPYLVGSFLLATLMAVLVGLFGYLLLYFSSENNLKEEV